MANENAPLLEMRNIKKDFFGNQVLSDINFTLKEGEVSTVIIAGMGGELIEQILGVNKEKSHSFKRFVLQPRTHANELRYYLTNHNYKFIDYKLTNRFEIKDKSF